MKINIKSKLQYVMLIILICINLRCTDSNDNIQCQYTLVTKVTNNTDASVKIIISEYPEQKADAGKIDTSFSLSAGEEYVYTKANSHYDRSVCCLHEEDYWQLCTGITAYKNSNSGDDSIGYWFIYPDVDTSEFMPFIECNTMTIRNVEIK